MLDYRQRVSTGFYYYYTSQLYLYGDPTVDIIPAGKTTITLSKMPAPIIPISVYNCKIVDGTNFGVTKNGIGIPALVWKKKLSFQSNNPEYIINDRTITINKPYNIDITVKYDTEEIDEYIIPYDVIDIRPWYGDEFMFVTLGLNKGKLNFIGNATSNNKSSLYFIQRPKVLPSTNLLLQKHDGEIPENIETGVSVVKSAATVTDIHNTGYKYVYSDYIYNADNYDTAFLYKSQDIILTGEISPDNIDANVRLEYADGTDLDFSYLPIASIPVGSGSSGKIRCNIYTFREILDKTVLIIYNGISGEVTEVLQFHPFKEK